jgi:hypothetical protein
MLFLLAVDDKAFSKLTKRPQRIVASKVNPAFSNNCEFPWEYMKK